MNQFGVPDNIKTATMLLYITLGIGLIRGIMEVPRFLMVMPLGFVLLIFFLVLGVMGFFIHMIWKGKNWARYTYIALFVIGFPFSILPWGQSITSNFLSGSLSVGQTALQIIAIVLLFQKSSSDWFKKLNTFNESK